MENIRLIMHENHWAKVKINIMEEEKAKLIPFDFGFEYGKVYKIVVEIKDYSGNEYKDTSYAVVGRPVIDKTPSGRPIQGYPINLSACGVLYGGGHNHNGNRPVSIFEANQGETNDSGEFRTYYFSSRFGEVKRIIAQGEDVSDSAGLTVWVPGLFYFQMVRCG